MLQASANGCRRLLAEAGGRHKESSMALPESISGESGIQGLLRQLQVPIESSRVFSPSPPAGVALQGWARTPKSSF